MIVHETPKEVSSVLARWAPRRISCLLDPSVGAGALVRPLISRLRTNESRIYCVDVDQDALDTVGERYGTYFERSMTLINDDFLKIDFNSALGDGIRFDCVVMNPPFAGRRQYLREVTVASDGNGNNSVHRKSPIEGAFLVRAAQLLKSGGRILAVLPSSIVSGSTAKWIREFLLNCGSILCVHELPHFTFKKVEARIYLLVFEKSVSSRRIILRNHKLVSPDELLLTKQGLGQDKRLDYGFQAARLWFEKLKSAIPEAGWSLLREHASIKRGEAESPEGIKRAIHTTDYKDGFWWLTRFKSRRLAKRSNKTLKNVDLLVTRVGRRSTDSMGTVVGSAPLDWTDCLIRIRPRSERSRPRLLFTMRCLLVCEEGRSLFQRGSSARYIAQSDLESLLIPWNLADMYAKIFTKYKTAVSRHRFRQMQNLERYVQSMLRRRLGNRC